MYAQNHVFTNPKFLPSSSETPSELDRGVSYNYDPNTMASDPRYIYPPPHPGMPYDYNAYPQYDPAHYPQPPQTHPRPTMPPNYHPQYPPVAAPPHHVMPPQQPWTPEAWSHYGYPQHPPPPQDPNTHPSVSPPVDPNRYPPQARASELAMSGATQPLLESQSAQAQNGSRPPSSEVPPPPSSSLDFMKMLDSYRMILETSAPFANDELLNAQGRPPPSELIEKMLSTASISVTMMEAGLKELDGQKPETTLEQNGNTNGAAPVSSPEVAKSPSRPPAVVAHTDSQTCLGCKATSTPEWRRGPMGPRTLCNACGLVYAKMIKKRGREAARARANGQSPSKDDITSGEGSDEDDDDEDSAEDG